MATLVSDTFDKANAAVVGPPQIGPAPVLQQGALAINTNQLYSTASVSLLTYEVGTPDVEISFVTSTLNAGYASLILGYVSANEYWQVSFLNATAVQLYQVYSATLAVEMARSSMKLPVITGTVCKAHYRNGVIRVYVDDVLVLRWAPDVLPTGTACGLKLHSANYPRLDNLLAVNAPVINEPVKPGAFRAAGLFGGPEYVPQAFAYRGRDTKIQDTTAGA